MNANIIPPINKGTEWISQAKIPIPIHSVWNVKHGRQLKGLRSNILCHSGRMMGRCLPSMIDSASIEPVASNIIVAFMHIDKVC